MQNLFLINSDRKNKLSIQLLQASCSKRGVKMKILEPGSVNCLNNTVNQNSSGLYRLSTAEYAISLEKTFIHQVAASFYSDVEKCIAKYDNVLEATLIHSENGLPIIPTVFHLTNNRSLLRKYYDFLEGPPIIIKNVGGAHGLGVVKVDSFSSLLSIVDYLMQNNQQAILRKFIKHREHARLIVLGDSVISSIAYQKPANDFRTNIGKKPSVVEKQYDAEIQAIAVRATRTLGFEFGGVDIIISENGTSYLAEVNFPCFFPRAQLLTGTDISGMMVDYLIEKANKNSSTITTN